MGAPSAVVLFSASVHLYVCNVSCACEFTYICYSAIFMMDSPAVQVVLMLNVTAVTCSYLLAGGLGAIWEPRQLLCTCVFVIYHMKSNPYIKLYGLLFSDQWGSARKKGSKTFKTNVYSPGPISGSGPSVVPLVLTPTYPWF